MVVEEKINEIYNLIISGEELTTKKLNSIGLNSNKIKEYVDNKIIKRVSRGIYELDNIDTMYNKLYEQIKDNKLHDAFILFEQIYNIDMSPKNKFILYLMNDIYKLSESLYKSCKEIDKTTIKLDSNDKLYKVYNNIFNNSLYKRDNKSIYIANIYLIDRDIQDEIICCLLEKRWRKTRTQINKINTLAHEHSYKEIIEILNRNKENSGLTIFEQNMLTICEKYIDISSTNKVPSICNIESNNLTDAINNNDFNKAYKMCVEYNSKNYILKDNSSMLLLLEDITKLIERVNNNVTFSQVMDIVKNNTDDLVKITSIIDKYLVSINKSNYSSILLDYLKLDILNNDYKYTNFRRICNGLEHNTYEYYIEYYVKQFYIELGRNNINKATTYLDIINNGIEIGYECPIITILEDALKYTKKFFNKEEIIIEQKNTEVEEIEEHIEEEYTSNEVVEDTIEEIPNKDIEYVNDLFSKLRDNKTFLIIKKLNDTRKDILKGMVIESNDITYLDTCSSFSIWYTPLKKEKIDYKELKIKGESLYKQHKLEEAIRVYNKLIEHGNFSSYTMARLGLIYYNLNNRNKCITYLTFATELSEKFNDDFDFTLLLSKLQGKEIPKDYDDRKYKVAFYENEFSKDNNYYGITNIDEIANMVSNGMSIEESCLSFNMSNEQINLVYLLYVKEYYMNGEYEIGDKLFKIVEKSSDKTDKVIREMGYIQKNKKFYIHRENCGNRLIKKIKA